MVKRALLLLFLLNVLAISGFSEATNDEKNTKLWTKERIVSFNKVSGNTENLQQ